MEYRTLGRSGLHVSRACLGAMMFGHSSTAPADEPKGFMPIGDGPNDRGLGRKYLTRALEDSRRRLDTGYIDLYQCHGPDADTPIEETMATLSVPRRRPWPSRRCSPGAA